LDYQNEKITKNSNKEIYSSLEGENAQKLTEDEIMSLKSQGNKYNTNFGSATPNDNFNVYNSIIRTPKTPVFPQTPKTTVFKNFIHVFEDSNDNYLLSLPSLPLSLQENYDVPHAVKNSKLIILNVL